MSATISSHHHQQRPRHQKYQEKLRPTLLHHLHHFHSLPDHKKKYIQYIIFEIALTAFLGALDSVTADLIFRGIELTGVFITTRQNPNAPREL